MDIQKLELELSRQARRRRQSGMTLIELLAVLAVVSSLASIAVPKYHAIADTARTARAIGDIQAIQITLDTRDSLPPSLASIGVSILDPWGRPYVYVKVSGWVAPGGSVRGGAQYRVRSVQCRQGRGDSRFHQRVREL